MSATSNIKYQTSNIAWRIIDILVGGIFIFAGLSKVVDLEHFHVGDIKHFQLADPAVFAGDIDNYKILPWTFCVGLAFYLPWLEIFCGLALIFRLLYHGALSILITLVGVFVVATGGAKMRGLDITCGCFGHASKNWSFSTHLALDLLLLASVILLMRVARGKLEIGPPEVPQFARK